MKEATDYKSRLKALKEEQARLGVTSENGNYCTLRG